MASLDTIHSPHFEWWGFPELRALFSLSLDIRTLALGALAAFLLLQFNKFVYQPLRVIAQLRKQGIRGPPYRFFVGNLPEIAESLKVVERGGRMLTNLDKWREEYGPIFYFSTGFGVFLVLIDPTLVKQIMLGTTGNTGLYRKDIDAASFEPFLGNYGLLFSSNETWSRHRKILNPEFHVGKLTEMDGAMIRHTDRLVRSWKDRVAAAGGRAEVEAHEDIYMLTCDILCETLFGYKDGAARAYGTQGNLYRDLGVLIRDTMGREFGPTVSNQFLWMFSGYRHLPLPINWRIARLRLRLRTMIAGFIKSRRAEVAAAAKATGLPRRYGDDVLAGLLSAADEKGLLSEEELMGECMTLFMVGHDSAAHPMTWALLLLAQHPEWQERARAEAREVCGDGPPTKDIANKLKVITMVFRETLRLFPPIVFVDRQAVEAHQLGGLQIAKDQLFLMPILTLHMDPEFWGDDAHTFNPARFENGLAGASKDPNAYLPFSMGPRSCLGQLYAMQQAKVVLAMIVRDFKFSVAPGYRHWADATLSQRPMLGVQLLVEKA